MKCAHCLSEFHDNLSLVYIGHDSSGQWAIESYTCPKPDCKKFNLFLINGSIVRNNLAGGFQVGINSSGMELINSRRLILPKNISRIPLGTSVPQSIMADYNEACIVLADSPKASAALSRRCLQQTLRLSAGIKPGDLSFEIQQVLDSNKLPSYLAENIDSIRNVGNFAAHPLKSTSTGEIVEVESGEADWNLEVLEMLFDFYFVQPAIAKQKRDLLNAKLADMKKPPMK